MNSFSETVSSARTVNVKIHQNGNASELPPFDVQKAENRQKKAENDRNSTAKKQKKSRKRFLIQKHLLTDGPRFIREFLSYNIFFNMRKLLYYYFCSFCGTHIFYEGKS